MQEATLAACYCPVASRYVPQCLTKLLAKPIRGEAEDSEEAFIAVCCSSFIVKMPSCLIQIMLLQHPCSSFYQHPTLLHLLLTLLLRIFRAAGHNHFHIATQHLSYLLSLIMERKLTGYGVQCNAIQCSFENAVHWRLAKWMNKILELKSEQSSCHSKLNQRH